VSLVERHGEGRLAVSLDVGSSPANSSGAGVSDRGMTHALRYAAIAGNIVFLLWILYNGVNGGFRGTRPKVVSYVGLAVLLLLNAILLIILGGRQKRS
jgi:hypothetical protein